MKRFFPILVLLIILFCSILHSEWLPDTIINDNNRRCRTGYNGARGIAANGNNIYAVWTEEYYEVFLKAKLNGVWTTSERISTGSPGGIYGISAYPSVAVWNNDVHVVWEDYRTGDFEIFYRRFSGGWGSPINLSGDPAESRVPVITVTSGGNILLMWQDNRTGIYEIYSKIYASGTWGTTEKLSSTSYYAGFPTVTNYGETVYAVWEEMENNGYELYYAIYSGGSWTNPQRITSNEGMSQYPSICCDPSGTIHLVWADDTDGNFQIYYSSFNGIDWSTPISVSNNPGFALYPQITSDPFGVIHLSWSDDEQGNYEIYHKSLVSNQWSNEENISQKEQLSTSPHITTTSNGSVHVIWYDWIPDSLFTSPHIRYKRNNPVNEALSRSVKCEVTNSGVRICAETTQTTLQLFRINSSYPILLKNCTVNGSKYIWYESLPPGEYEYILQSINGTDVHYSKPIPVSIPQEGDFSELIIFPNPFTAEVIFKCSGISDNQNTVLKIYDVSGRLVKSFSLNTNHSALTTEVSWEGRDDRDQIVPSGIYFLRLYFRNQTLTRTVMKL